MPSGGFHLRAAGGPRPARRLDLLLDRPDGLQVLLELAAVGQAELAVQALRVAAHEVEHAAAVHRLLGAVALLASWLGSPKRRLNTARGLISLGSGSVGLFQAIDDE
jgi:hypothetical protein